MKNLSLLIMSLLVTISISSCKDDDDKSGYSAGCVLNVPCEDPAGLISVALADEYEEQYKTEFYSYIMELKQQQYPGYDGAVRYVWFDMDEIKKYILYVEKYAGENGYEGLGLRVYLGSKEQESPEGNIFKRQTVFFVPTATTHVTDKNGNIADENQNIAGIDRLNLGGAGLPDDVDQEDGF